MTGRRTSDKENVAKIVYLMQHMRFVSPDSEIIAFAAANGVHARINALEKSRTYWKGCAQKLFRECNDLIDEKRARSTPDHKA